MPTVLGTVGSPRDPGAFADTAVLSGLRRRGHAVSSGRLDLPAGPAPEIDGVFALNRALADRVREAVADGAVPLALTGDCTACLGVLGGMGRPVGIVWLDAHGDFNTPETTLTGFLGGMPLAASVGRCWQERCASIPGFAPVPEDQVVLVGARALDPLEADLLKRSTVHVLDDPALRRHGVRRALRDALSTTFRRGEDVYLHLDLDVLDPTLARANRYAEPGGMTPDEVLEAIRIVGEYARVRAAAVSAYDPAYDTDGRAMTAGREAIAALADVMRGSR